MEEANLFLTEFFILLHFHIFNINLIMDFFSNICKRQVPNKNKNSPNESHTCSGLKCSLHYKDLNVFSWHLTPQAVNEFSFTPGVFMCLY